MRKNQRHKNKHSVKDAPEGKVQGDRSHQQSGKIFSSYQICCGLKKKEEEEEEKEEEKRRKEERGRRKEEEVVGGGGGGDWQLDKCKSKCRSLCREVGQCMEGEK